MNKTSNTNGLAEPFGAYSHACEVPGGSRLLFLAGQVGVRPDGTVAETVEEQVQVALENILTSLREVGMDKNDIFKMTVLLCERDSLKGYRAARDRVLGDVHPPNTLMFVSGLANPSWQVEIEVMAAKSD
jgi:enamine deaminase RidA (YjgF/YER057c/UK114 family)